MQQFEAKTSSNIAWARYHEDTCTLEIDFKDKAGNRTTTYAYDGFSKEAWDKFNMAESHGKYFAFEIRPRYQGRKIRG